jgi:outer membrane murein-binding lipoprotein Lpp
MAAWKRLGRYNGTEQTEVSMRAAILGLFMLSIHALAGCSSTQIAVKESLGYAKREQLVDRVEDARDGQEAAKEQFESALAEFLSVTGVETGDLEKKYSAVKKQYDRCEDRAGAVNGRIKDVERVATALFKEWDAELEQYSSSEMRATSKRQLDDTRAKYEQLVSTMKQAAAKMDPVLAAFKDQTLFLKHNLNARAIASLQETSGQIQSDVQTLVAEMQQAINEANAFIQEMQAGQG